MTDVGLRARSSPGRAGAWLPWLGLLAIAVTIATGLLIADAGHYLGTPLPPFLMRWRPNVAPAVWIPAVVVLVGVWWAPRLVASAWSVPAVSALLYGAALALGLSINVARTGVFSWSSVFAIGRGGSFEGSFEYLSGLPALAHGTHYYVSHFAALFPYLPTHVRGNPPGPLVALHLLGIRTADPLATLCILLGALTAPLAYDLGRVVVGDERAARTAGVLTAFSPALILFGVTSTDYAYAAVGLGAACLLCRPSLHHRVAGGLLVGAGAFFSYLLLAIPAWAVLLTWRRSGLRDAAGLAAWAAAGVLAVTGVLALTLGYDPFSAVRATAHAYRVGNSSTRPYAFWVLGSPVAWAAMLGLPLAWLGLRALAEREPSAVALAAVIAVASVLGLTKAETERIWLPFVPLACVAAATVLPPRWLRPVLLTLGAQALAVEVLCFTTW